MTHIPKINIGLFGLGTVGGSVYELLEGNQGIAEKLGFPINIKKICELDSKRIKQHKVPHQKVTTKSDDILDDPEISIVVELIGDRPVAKEIMMNALKLGKHVVTANKAILAKHGPELYTLAEKNGVDLSFEASVAGAIPVLRAIREGFIADQLLSIHGIINGTANYILTAMDDEGRDFQDALKSAQERGFAETDPTSDIEGIDTAHKLVIMMALAYGKIISLEEVHREGISQLTAFDLQMAHEFGYTIKLLAISKLDEDGNLEARVHPTMIKQKDPLASVRGVFNAVKLHGKFLGESILYGHGAGGDPTATAVAADIIEIAKNIALQLPGYPPLGYKIENMKKAKIKSMGDIECAYYLRFNTPDKPGILAKIAHALGQNSISISSVHQHAQDDALEVPIVVVTHKAREKNVINALREID